MKNFSRFIFILFSLSLITACGDDNDSDQVSQSSLNGCLILGKERGTPAWCYIPVADTDVDESEQGDICSSADDNGGEKQLVASCPDNEIATCILNEGENITYWYTDWSDSGATLLCPVDREMECMPGNPQWAIANRPDDALISTEAEALEYENDDDPNTRGGTTCECDGELCGL